MELPNLVSLGHVKHWHRQNAQFLHEVGPQRKKKWLRGKTGSFLKTHLVQRQLQAAGQLHDQLKGEIYVLLIEVIHVRASRKMRTDIGDFIQRWTLECVSEVLQCVQRGLLYFKLFSLNKFTEEKHAIVQ